jgi:glycosyltransferase involved in cell wall biosynthesis
MGSTPGRQRRITLVSDYFPEDAERQVHGAFQRLQRHIRSLQRIGRLDVIFLWPWGESAWTETCAASLAGLRQRWNIDGRIDRVNSAFTAQVGLLRVLLPASLPPVLGRMVDGRESACGDAIAAILDETRPDLIFAHRMGAALPVVRRFAGRYPIVGFTHRYPIVVDFDDVEHIRMGREVNHPANGQSAWRLHLAAWLTRRLEREVLARASVSLVCSAADADFLRPLVAGARIALLPNSSPRHDALPPSPAPTAFFVGMARYRPNAEGLVWLAREVWPLVRRDLPAARLVLAGMGSDELGLADIGLGIEALGFVPDLATFYGRAGIALCPLRAASGTRIKIIEAAMYGRACVSTGIGAEGLALENGRSIALHDDAAAFAKACVDLLSDPARATAMGLAARDVASRLYAQDALEEQLDRICLRALEQDRIRLNQPDP